MTFKARPDCGCCWCQDGHPSQCCERYNQAPPAISAAAELGIPAEPPAGHVPSEPYYPPPPKSVTIEDRLAALEYQVEVLRLELVSARASIPSRSYYHPYCVDR